MTAAELERLEAAANAPPRTAPDVEVSRLALQSAIAEVRRLQSRETKLQYCLRIFLHAWQTDNRVPPQTETEARALLAEPTE
jgi:hypothetical protein